MSRTYCRIVHDEIVFEVTDHHVLSDLWDFPEPVPLEEIASIEIGAYRQPPGHLVLACLGLLIGVLGLWFLLRDADLSLAKRIVFGALLIAFVIHFVVVLHGYLAHKVRHITITTTDGKRGVLFRWNHPTMFDPFYGGLQAGLADRDTVKPEPPPGLPG